MQLRFSNDSFNGGSSASTEQKPKRYCVLVSAQWLHAQLSWYFPLPCFESHQYFAFKHNLNGQIRWIRRRRNRTSTYEYLPTIERHEICIPRSRIMWKFYSRQRMYRSFRWHCLTPHSIYSFVCHLSSGVWMRASQTFRRSQPTFIATGSSNWNGHASVYFHNPLWYCENIRHTFSVLYNFHACTSQGNDASGTLCSWVFRRFTLIQIRLSQRRCTPCLLNVILLFVPYRWLLNSYGMSIPSFIVT